MTTLTTTRPNPLVSWCRQHPMISYYLLALAISTGLVLPLIATKLGWFDSQIAADWHILGAAGPCLAALIITGLVAGRAGIKKLLSRFAYQQKLRGWYLVAIFSPVILLGASVIVAGLTGSWPDFGKLGAPAYANPGWWLVSVLLISVAYGFGEEFGWRGFLLPRLQQRYNPLIATLILSVLWVAWHSPFFIYRYQMDFFSFLGFYICLVGGTFWLTFLYNRTGSSLLAVALWHTVWDVVNFIAGPISPSLAMILNLMVMVIGPLTLFIGWRGWLTAKKQA